MSLADDLEKAAEGVLPELAIAAMTAFAKVPVWLAADAVQVIEQLVTGENVALAKQVLITDAADAATDAALGLDPETKREG